MSKLAEVSGMRTSGAAATGVVERPVYYVSSRPEAYEVAGEVGHEEAIAFGRLIAERAGRRFPDVEFRVDGDWHSHQAGMERVAAFIDAHWQDWVRAARA